jgi:hypothetical protein
MIPREDGPSSEQRLPILASQCEPCEPTDAQTNILNLRARIANHVLVIGEVTVTAAWAD